MTYSKSLLFVCSNGLKSEASQHESNVMSLELCGGQLDIGYWQECCRSVEAQVVKSAAVPDVKFASFCQVCRN